MNLQVAQQLLQASIDAYMRPTIVVGDNAALIEQTSLGLVIAFRGTVPPTMTSVDAAVLSFEDWLNDADMVLTAVPYAQGLVHSGFAESLDDLWLQIWKNMPDEVSDLPLFVTGHSKGGALATLFAIRDVGPDSTTAKPAVTVYTFGSPSVGDQAFATAYNAAIPNHFRFEDRNDVVPHLPPCPALRDALGLLSNTAHLFDKCSQPIPEYVPVGQLEFIDWSEVIEMPVAGTIAAHALEWERDGRLLFAGDSLVTNHFTQDYQAVIGAYQ